MHLRVKEKIPSQSSSSPFRNTSARWYRRYLPLSGNDHFSLSFSLHHDMCIALYLNISDVVGCSLVVAVLHHDIRNPLGTPVEMPVYLRGLKSPRYLRAINGPPSDQEGKREKGRGRGS